MAFGALGIVPDVVEAADPKTLEGKIAASFAAQLVDSPVSQLVEIALAGGGAGGLFQATIYYSTEEDGNFPPLGDQFVKVVWGSDPLTVLDKLADFYATVAVDRTTFVEKVAGGSGILWVDLIVYTIGEDEELLALGLVDVEEVRASELMAAPPPPEEESEEAIHARRERVAKRLGRLAAKRERE